MVTVNFMREEISGVMRGSIIAARIFNQPGRAVTAACGNQPPLFGPQTARTSSPAIAARAKRIASGAALFTTLA